MTAFSTPFSSLDQRKHMAVAATDRFHFPYSIQAFHCLELGVKLFVPVAESAPAVAKGVHSARLRSHRSGEVHPTRHRRHRLGNVELLGLQIGLHAPHPQVTTPCNQGCVAVPSGNGFDFHVRVFFERVNRARVRL